MDQAGPKRAHYQSDPAGPRGRRLSDRQEARLGRAGSRGKRAGNRGAPSVIQPGGLGGNEFQRGDVEAQRPKYFGGQSIEPGNPCVDIESGVDFESFFDIAGNRRDIACVPIVPKTNDLRSHSQSLPIGNVTIPGRKVKGTPLAAVKSRLVSAGMVNGFEITGRWRQ